MNLFQRVSGADALIWHDLPAVAQFLSLQISFVDSDSLWSRLIVCAIHSDPISNAEQLRRQSPIELLQSSQRCRLVRLIKEGGC